MNIRQNKNKKQKKGSVLILVIFVLLFSSILVGTISYLSQASFEILLLERNKINDKFAAKSVEQEFSFLLLTSSYNALGIELGKETSLEESILGSRNIEGNDETTYQNIIFDGRKYLYEYNNQQYILRLYDGNAFLPSVNFDSNMYQRYLNFIGYNKTESMNLASLWVDFIDANSILRARGAEKNAYKIRYLFEPTNTPYRSLVGIKTVLKWDIFGSEELLWHHNDAFLPVLNDENINPNFASLKLIEIYYDLNPNQLDRLKLFRKDNIISNQVLFNNVIGKEIDLAMDTTLSINFYPSKFLYLNIYKKDEPNRIIAQYILERHSDTFQFVLSSKEIYKTSITNNILFDDQISFTKEIEDAEIIKKTF